MITQQLPREFLEALAKQQNRETYARITNLTFADELPVEQLEGRVTQGSLNLDGKSSVRRSVSLTLVSQDLNIDNYLWGLNHKFELELGVRNYTDPKYPDIIWFNYGKYVFTAFTPNLSENNYTISLTGQDKMCLLNGTIGGNLNALNYRFDILEEVDVDGNVIQTKMPLKDIIREAVHKFGNEPYQNIIINDLDDQDQLNLIQYIGEDYFYLGFPIDEPKKIIQLEAFTECEFEGKIIAISELENSGGYYQANNELNSNIGSLVIIEGTKYNIKRIAPYQTIGYTTQQLTYPKELTAKTGETLTSILDKIKQIIPGYEYFYNVDGRFVFQKNKTYVELPYSTEIQGETQEPLMFSSEIAFTFENNQLNTTFKDSPQYNNIKNDFSFWGSRTSASGVEVPILYRYIVGKRPTYYKTIEITEKDITLFNDRYKPTIPRVWEKYKGGIEYSIDAVDWREIIYQMALDQDKWGMYLDDFSVRLAAANPNQYPSGKTGYEPYYIDFLGFWRQVYNKEPEDSYSLFSIPSFGTQDYFNITKDIILYKQAVLDKYTINSISEYGIQKEKLINNIKQADQALITLQNQDRKKSNIIVSNSNENFQHLKFILFLLDNFNTGFKLFLEENQSLTDIAANSYKAIHDFLNSNLEQKTMAEIENIINIIEELYTGLTTTINIDNFKNVPCELSINIINGILQCMSNWGQNNAMINPEEKDLDKLNDILIQLKEVYYKVKYQYASELNQLKHFKVVLEETKAMELIDRLSWVLNDWGKILNFYHFEIELLNSKQYVEAESKLLMDNNINLYTLENNPEYYYYTNREIYVPDDGLEITEQQAKNMQFNYKITSINWSQVDKLSLETNMIVYQEPETKNLLRCNLKMQKIDDLLQNFKDWINMFEIGIIGRGYAKSKFQIQIETERQLILKYDGGLGTIDFNSIPWKYQDNETKQIHYLPIMTSTGLKKDEISSLQAAGNYLDKQMARELFYYIYMRGYNGEQNIYKDNNLELKFYSLNYLLNQLSKIDKDSQTLITVKDNFSNCLSKNLILDANEPFEGYIQSDHFSGLDKDYKEFYSSLKALITDLENKVKKNKNLKYYKIVENTSSVDELYKIGITTLMPYLDFDKTIPVKYTGEIEKVIFYSKTNNINNFDSIIDGKVGCTTETLYTVLGSEAIPITHTYVSYPRYYDSNRTNYIKYYTKDNLWQENGWHINIKTPELLNFWFDMLDSDSSYLGRYAVERIGNRTKSQNDTKTKTLFNYNIPALIIQYQGYQAEERQGYSILDLQMTEEEFNNNFSISSQVLSAKNQIETLMEKHLFKNSNLSITSMPIYHLEPNSRIRVIDSQMKISDEYIVSKLTIPLTYNGTMTITGSLAPINIY